MARTTHRAVEGQGAFGAPIEHTQRSPAHLEGVDAGEHVLEHGAGGVVHGEDARRPRESEHRRQHQRGSRCRLDPRRPPRGAAAPSAAAAAAPTDGAAAIPHRAQHRHQHEEVDLRTGEGGKRLRYHRQNSTCTRWCSGHGLVFSALCLKCLWGRKDERTLCPLQLLSWTLMGFSVEGQSVREICCCGSFSFISTARTTLRNSCLKALPCALTVVMATTGPTKLQMSPVRIDSQQLQVHTEHCRPGSHWTCVLCCVPVPAVSSTHLFVQKRNSRRIQCEMVPKSDKTLKCAFHACISAFVFKICVLPVQAGKL